MTGHVRIKGKVSEVNNKAEAGIQRQQKTPRVINAVQKKRRPGQVPLRRRTTCKIFPESQKLKGAYCQGKQGETGMRAARGPALS